MFSAATLVSLIDRQLLDQPGVRASLARHVGKQVHLRLPLLVLDFRILEDGGLAAAAPAEAVAAAITVAPEILFALALGEHDALRRASVTGDAVLAADLSAALVRFDWALALRPYLGDIVAARAAQALAGLGQWRVQATESAGLTLAEYATFEAGLLADRLAVRRFVAEVDQVRDGVARLAARLAILEGQAR